MSPPTSGSTIDILDSISSIPCASDTSSGSEGYKSDESSLDMSAIRAMGPVLEQLTNTTSGGERLGFQMTRVLLNELVSFYEASRKLSCSPTKVSVLHSSLFSNLI